MTTSTHRWVLVIPVTWLVLLLAAPLAIVLLIAFAVPADRIPPFNLGFTLDNLRLVATDPLYRNALLRSLRVAGISTLICLVMGFPAALAIARAPIRWRNALLLAVMLPFWTGFLMRINAWIGLLADDGLIVRLLGTPHLLYTDTAMYIGMVYTYLPFMVLPLYARLSRLDPALMRAAADLGAPPWRVFLRIILPLSRPGITAGAEGFAAFAHQRIDHWMSRTRDTAQDGYPAAVALLRAVYDMVDAVKAWETATGPADGNTLLQQVCDQLDAQKPDNRLRPRTPPQSPSAPPAPFGSPHNHRATRPAQR